MFKQTRAVTALSLASIPQRPLAAIVTVVGVAAVVAVMVSLLAISTGLIASTNKSVKANSAIVLSSGATAEYMGALPREDVDIVAQAPGIARDARGPIVTPAATVIVEFTRKTDGTSVNAGFRAIRPGDFGRGSNTIRLTAGRMFRPGVRELIAGKQAARQFRDLSVGDHIKLRGSDWTVVGQFEDNGGLAENGVIGDADTVLSAFDRNAYTSIGVMLTSPKDFQRFKDALTTDPRLQVEVKSSREYIGDQLKQVTSIINFVAYFVGTVMAIGAIFGAVNTMYSVVDARAREIATLRAIGFSGLPVVVSVLTETLMLAIPGALLGVAIAWLLFNGHSGQISSLSFPLAVTSQHAVLAVIWALVIGLLGGLAPSIRAARLPVATALRAT